MTAPYNFINKVLDTFNSLYSRIKFTLEVRRDKLNFLDIIKNDSVIEFDWFHKPTFSDRFINYYSLHPLSQKRGVIIDMFDRAVLLLYLKYHSENVKFVNTFLKNDYPIEFIFNTTF